jgi:hypothetical protein
MRPSKRNHRTNSIGGWRTVQPSCAEGCPRCEGSSRCPALLVTNTVKSSGVAPVKLQAFVRGVGSFPASWNLTFVAPTTQAGVVTASSCSRNRTAHDICSDRAALRSLAERRPAESKSKEPPAANSPRAFHERQVVLAFWLPDEPMSKKHAGDPHRGAAMFARRERLVERPARMLPPTSFSATP